MEKSQNFIRNLIDDHLKSHKDTLIQTRFPPEPNGFLHLGHAKSIVLNFGIKDDYKGKCNLRFDDTNPSNEDDIYVQGIKEDIEWLGYTYDREFHASDYFDRMHDCAIRLIKMDLAYVCSLSADQMKDYRGTLSEPGKKSPDRDRSIAQNLDLFERMKNKEFSEGTYTLRAKIDMASGNINLRDPAIYRIKHVSHHRQKDKWCIYPMYDYAHCLSDYFEGITHSLCTLEFADHRALYDWFLQQLFFEPRPHQYEFARLNLTYTVMSKRKLKQLVEGGYVTGWDDPRLMTLKGMRRRGYTGASIRRFCEAIGVSKKESVLELSYLEECLREDLNIKANRAMCVLRPLKVVIKNTPIDFEISLTAACHPKDPTRGSRTLQFTHEIWIEKDDFSIQPSPDFNGLTLNGKIKLRNAYVLECKKVVYGTSNEIVSLECEIDLESLGPKPKGIKGVIHWVSCRYGVPAKVCLFDRLFLDADPSARNQQHETFLDALNPNSLLIEHHAVVEPSAALLQDMQWLQFERTGYFVRDTKQNELVFNRSVSLKDTWEGSK